MTRIAEIGRLKLEIENLNRRHQEEIARVEKSLAYQGQCAIRLREENAPLRFRCANLERTVADLRLALARALGNLTPSNMLREELEKTLEATSIEAAGWAYAGAGKVEVAVADARNP